LADNVIQLSERTRQVHVIFNNCYQDFAQRNARQFATLLERAGRAS
jgi:uncharacterized protein YecE (DUF72 family)